MKQENKEALIAVIGLSGVFPGAGTLEEFWDNLRNGISSISEVPPDRWRIEEYYDRDVKVPDKSTTKMGGFIDGADQFEPLFFNITDREAEIMDPQQRLTLVECWKALENSGYAPESLSDKKVGVYIGAREGDYCERILEAGFPPDAYTMMGKDLAILVARVSYLLNLKGPNMPVNTACSSSLVAIHLACGSLLSGECSLGIAGGVFVMSSHDFFVKTAKANMFSAEGRCKTFDNDADGFVPGEGGGVVILKRLAEAEADKDTIHAVIRATGINHDGKTNGITAPGKAAQSALEQEVYSGSHINPESISYVEAHGTGTKLGDPVEIHALTEAFGQYTSQKQYCPIGSVKTNIGHLAAAAGVAGLIKVILALKNKQIPPSLNFHKENELINFKETPFFVNTKLLDWKESQNNLPRRAALSSFGYSGTNAHVIIDEYIKDRAESRSSGHKGDSPSLVPVPVSARSRESLGLILKRLLKFLIDMQKRKLSYKLEDIAFTLQCGRNHFEYRYLFIVTDVNELIQKLKIACDGKEHEDIFYGDLSLKFKKVWLKKKEVDDLLHEIRQKTDKKACEEYKRLLGRLAGYYIQGIPVKWRDIYKTGSLPGRVPLPGYVFNTARFWIDVPPESERKRQALHPFVHCNCSTLYEQKYATSFSPLHPYIKEHVINKKPLLPGAVMLEMVRAASFLAGEKRVKSLSDITWWKPLFFENKEQRLIIKLRPDNADNLKACLKFSVASGDNGSLYAGGLVEYGDNEVPEKLDIESIKRRCIHEIGRDELYKYFSDADICYGARFRCTETVFTGKRECLALITLSVKESLSRGQDLHPLLVDNILHSISGALVSISRDTEIPYVPCFLGKLALFRPLEKKIYAYGVITENNRMAKSFNISVINSLGEMLLAIDKLILKPVSRISAPGEQAEFVLLKNRWSEKKAFSGSAPPGGVNTRVLLFDIDRRLFNRLKKDCSVLLVIPGSAFEKIDKFIYTIEPETESHYQRLFAETGALDNQDSAVLYFWNRSALKEHPSAINKPPYPVYRLTVLSRTLMQWKRKKRVAVLYFFRDNGPFDTACDAAVSGFARTVAKEDPDIFIKTIRTSSGRDKSGFTQLVISEIRGCFEKDFEVRYASDFSGREVKSLETMSFEKTSARALPVRAGGVYLITGGLGGVGKIVARHLAEFSGVSLVLSGRSAPDAESRDFLKKLGPNTVYYQADVASPEDVRNLRTGIFDTFGRIDGIVHSAGVIRDSFLIHKEREMMDAVLAPKIAGTMNLVDVFGKDAFSFFIFFSSVSAVEGQIGQTDYAYANCFINNYIPCFSGLTVVNWSLWENGGMQIPHSLKMKMEKKGLRTIPDSEGLRAFDLALCLDENDITVVMKNDEGQTHFRTSPAVQSLPEIGRVSMETAAEEEAVSDGIIRERAGAYFKKILAEETKINEGSIRTEKSFFEYGIDSIMTLNLTEKLEEDFGKLAKTIFFECQNIRELIAYFFKNHRERLLAVVGSERNIRKQEISFPERFITEKTFAAEPERSALDVAIIGLSGRYPMADSIDQLWENLKTGKDCITEIPGERWDYKRYFSEDRKKKGAIYTKWGGFINDYDKFDPLFFKLSPKEAQGMDPQERLFLQEVWHTFEDAGYSHKKINEMNIGVYVGVMWAQYHFFGVEQTMQCNPMSLNSSFSSIANRVSYVFNLHGPSLAVDTMCSSSLTAIHLACESVLKHESEMAIAGGVNLTLHQDKYLSVSQGAFASSDGRCRSFGEGGTGYVPGEGVGVLLLKSLDKALADKDRIYGIIKSTAVNHGGKTNSYTVPNPKAQQKLIEEAYRNAAISPESVSYIEAHGTGTALGDPIEITGLTNAFRKSSTKRQYCAIGSIKSNIGHLEAAAGVAGVTKVLLQMKYKKIVPSLHSKQLNPYIDFLETPFYVQQELTDWTGSHDDTTTASPRRAGVSAFGAGGANAHVIIEEYPEYDYNRQGESGNKRRLFVLSARNHARLTDYARVMAGYLSEKEEAGGLSGWDLDRIVETLQNSRSSLEERLAVIFSDITQLIGTLVDFAEERPVPENLYHGNIYAENNDSNILFSGSAGKSFVSEILADRDWEKVAVLWVKGALDIEQRQTLVPFPLPGYPFAKQRYWFARQTSDSGRNPVKKPHPLIDENISDFYTQVFKSTFLGNEFFFTDHRVGTEKCLPGAACIEMALAAGIISCKADVVRIKDLVWEKPIVVNGSARDVFVSLYPGNTDDWIEFEIHTSGDDEPELVNCSGKIMPAHEPIAFDPEVVPIPELLKNFSAGLRGKRFYDELRGQHLSYGPAFRPVREVFSDGKMAVALLELPERVAGEFGDYHLHPVLIDGALQTVSRLLRQEPHKVYLPCGCAELEIRGALVRKCYVIAERGSGGGGRVDSYTIKITDEKGLILVIIRDFVLTQVDEELFFRKKGVREKNGLVYYRHEWVAAGGAGPVQPLAGKSILVVDGTDDLIKKLEKEGRSRNIKFLWIKPGARLTLDNSCCEINKRKVEDFEAVIAFSAGQAGSPSGIILNFATLFDSTQNQQLPEEITDTCFFLARALLKNKVKDITWLTIFSGRKNGLPGVMHSAIDGFYKSLRLEAPGYAGKTLSLSDTGEEAARILKEMEIPDYMEVVYKNNRRFVNTLCKILPEQIERNTDLPLKDDGVYLITGGTGGIGSVLCEYLTDSHPITLVVVGRSALPEDKKNRLSGLGKRSGAHVEYMRGDISVARDVESLIKKIVQKFGTLNGIIHCAGILRDSLIINKTKSGWQEVLKAKIRGTLNLDEASKDHELDFFILFSSIASVLGNRGQSDYSLANRFLDYFSLYREEKRERGLRTGKTVAINWPLWDGTGMGVDERTRRTILHETGLEPISRQEGLRAFTQCLCFPFPQIIVARGDETKISASLRERTKFFPVHMNTDKEGQDLLSLSDTASIRKKLLTYLKQVIAEEIDLAPELMNPEKTFDHYGLDSIVIMAINDKLALEVENLSQALLYEYITLDALADYFLTRHSLWAVRKFSDGEVQEKRDTLSLRSSGPRARPSQGNEIRAGRNFFPRKSRDAGGIGPSASRDIAIIGISGKYPMADNLDEFWNNLKEGRDCISEIPAERWDYNDYFDGAKNKQGKSYSKWGGFIDRADNFDCLFFNISPGDAENMDPQERLFLQCSWHTIEDAGYKVSALAQRKVGVFAGAMWSLYQLYGAQEMSKGNFVYPASSFSSIANRVSYCFNFHGPSIAIDTMCSSAVTAIHLACQSLRQKECEYALAGGVNLSLHPYKYLVLSDSSFISSDGRCRAFGAGGDGYVPGEGVGVILLKSLERARADRDHIYGVIKSSAINHGGKTAGFSTPNPNLQAELIQEAFEKGNLDPRSISYIEAHGPGTSLGDPIEISGLLNSLGKSFDNSKPCPIGSVKSNIGHLESAAGIAGLTKILLQMKYRKLVPSIHSGTLNPYIKFDSIPFFVQHAYEDWEVPPSGAEDSREECKRRACLNSFGAGGSYGHLIVEEYIDAAGDGRPESAERPGNPFLFVLSAQNEERLREYAETLALFLEKKTDEITPEDTAYTLQTGREEFNSRLVVLAYSLEEVITKLRNYGVQDMSSPRLYTATVGSENSPLSFILEGDEKNVYLKSLLENRKYEKVALLWLTGVSIDWSLLYEGWNPRRISLPLYPFAREKYWVAALAGQGTSAGKIQKEQDTRPVKLPADNAEQHLSRIIMDKISLFLKVKREILKESIEMGEVGLTSIIVLRILNELNETYAVRILPSHLKLKPQLTLGELTGRISSLIKPEKPVSASQEDMREGSAADKSAADYAYTELFPGPLEMSSRLKTDTILLTGATGVLGGRILHDLLKMTGSTVYCLVRGKDENEAFSRLSEMVSLYDPRGGLAGELNGRVIPVTGDITAPNLKMDQTLYEDLAKKIDLVIHSAAAVSLSGDYAEVKVINEKGTERMIDFTLKTSQKYFVFLSTHVVMGDRWLRRCDPFTETDLVMGQSFENMGYQQSKYNSEIQTRLSGKKGLKWIIIRSGNIMGDSKRGYYPFGITRVTGLYYDLIRTAIELQAAPDTPLYFDITPVDYISESILYLATIRKSVYETYHVTNPDFRKAPYVYRLVRNYGYPLSIISHRDYMELLNKKARDVRSETSVIIELMRFNPVFRLPLTGSSHAANAYTKAILEDGNISCAEIDAGLIKVYLDYCIARGVLKRENSSVGVN